MLGANALDILDEIGVYEELFKHMPDPRKVSMPGFTIVFGNAPGDYLYSVSLRIWVIALGTYWIRPCVDWQ